MRGLEWFRKEIRMYGKCTTLTFFIAVASLSGCSATSHRADALATG